MGVRELKEKASSLIASGHYERAEVLLRQALLQSPRDAQTWLKHAEVLKRLARNRAAAGSYRLAARLLDDEGHHARSIAALKLALAELPDDVDIITDIIRSELRARRSEHGVRSMFPVSSPSQLLASVSASESGLFTPPTHHDEAPQLALPMAPHAAPAPSPSDDARARVAAERHDTWAPEPEPSLPPPPASVPQFDTTGPVEPPPAPLPPPRPSAPVRLEVDTGEQWPQVCRLSDTRLAVKAGPATRWVVVESAAPLTVRFEDVVDVPDDAAWLE